MADLGGNRGDHDDDWDDGEDDQIGKMAVVIMERMGMVNMKKAVFLEGHLLVSLLLLIVQLYVFFQRFL